MMNVIRKNHLKGDHTIPEEKYESYAEFYGDDLEKIIDARMWTLDLIDKTNDLIGMGLEPGVAPIMYITSRLKDPESMKRKLMDRGLAVNHSNATRILHDSVGCRVVCSFKSDVYRAVDILKQLADSNVVECKDYIKHPKPSGYRSYHVILRDPNGVMVEVQLRTLAMDSWAALEHQLNYKHEVADKNVRRQLHECADKVAMVDDSMQSMKSKIMRDDLI